MAETRKIIAVAGATGAQGGGVVRAILNDPRGGFAVRALTRDPSSDAAKALADAGAEVVAADVHDLASLERALAGAWGAYCVTFFWAHMSPDREREEARNLATAAKRAGVHHTIWSTLDDTREWVPLDDDRMPTLQGEYKVPHFDVKGECNALFTELGVPTTFLRTSFYWDNFIHFGMNPKPGEDGVLVLSLPMGDKKLSGIAAADIGACAYGIFKRGDEMIGRTIGIAGGHLTGAEMAAAMGRAFGREVRYQAVPFEVYRGLGFPGADDLGNMFQVKHDFNDEYVGRRSVELSRSLHPGLQTFDAWLAANRDAIPKS